MSRYDGRFLQSYERWDEYIDRGRDKYSRPLCNNTVVRRRGERIAITYHSTDLYTFHANGDIFLTNGGYETVSTRTRMPHTVFSGRYVGLGRAWYVERRPSSDDPRPAWPSRRIPHPFTVEYPGPEPIKDPAGCRVGEVERKLVERGMFVPVGECTQDELDNSTSYGPRSERWVHRTVEESTLYTEDYPSYWEHRESGYDHVTRCPHCDLFDQTHRRWSYAMFGCGYGARGRHGYTQMCEYLERYETRKRWLLAAREDWRRVRRERDELRAWYDRNSQCMDDGPVLIDSDGYAMTLTVAQRRRLVAQRARERREAEFLKRIERGELAKQVYERIIARRVKLGTPTAELLVEALASAGYRPFDFLDPDGERATIGPIRDRRREMIRSAVRQFCHYNHRGHVTEYARKILR